MSSTSTVCQGLQSCLEPRSIVEPRVLTNKRTPPKSNFSHSSSWLDQKSNLSGKQEENENSLPEKITRNINDDDNGPQTDCNRRVAAVDGRSWSFLDALAYSANHRKQFDSDETEQVYVHPMVKRSSSTLSSKSLEMCTESLGSETGSDTGESVDEFLCFSSERLCSPESQRSKSREFGKKLNRSGSLPPPLTSISGSDGVQVRTHREGGRLVIKAVAVTACTTYFQAERGGGRLRLSLLKSGGFAAEDDDTEESEDDYMRHGGEEESVDEETEGLGDDDEDDDDNVVGGGGWEAEEGERGGVGGAEYGRSSSAMSGRCKESGSRNKGIPSSCWGPFCVAIS